MREPTIWKPTDAKIIEAAVDRFFQRMQPAGGTCQMIAPVCAACGREIDKDSPGWFHMTRSTTASGDEAER